MTPKEKAKELVDRFDLPTGIMTIERKQCALICVDEILKAGEQEIVNQYFDDRYWQEVKQEINKL